MASNKTFRFGPVAMILTTPTNILNPPTAAGGTGAGSSAQYIVLKHIRIVNKHASTAAKFTCYLGATGGSAAGTEVIGFGTAVPVGSYVDWYGSLRLDAADFLTGFSDTTVALTIEGEGEIGVSG